MLKRSIVLIPLLLILSSCGPIIGQVMRISEGVKSFKVVEGDLSALQGKKSVLVVGPFAKEADAFYIARGDDAAMFYNEILAAKYMEAELYIGPRYGDLSEMAASLRSMDQGAMQKELHLKATPDLLMFGTVLTRDTIVAPMRGIIMQVGYRLEFYDQTSKTSTIIEIEVKDHFKDCIKTIVAEIARQTTVAMVR